jgi:hypothetical protein
MGNGRKRALGLRKGKRTIRLPSTCSTCLHRTWLCDRGRRECLQGLARVEMMENQFHYCRSSSIEKGRRRTLVLDHMLQLASHGQAKEDEEVDQEYRPVHGNVGSSRQSQEEGDGGRSSGLKPELELCEERKEKQGLAKRRGRPSNDAVPHLTKSLDNKTFIETGRWKRADVPGSLLINGLNSSSPSPRAALPRPPSPDTPKKPIIFPPRPLTPRLMSVERDGSSEPASPPSSMFCSVRSEESEGSSRGWRKARKMLRRKMARPSG